MVVYFTNPMFVKQLNTTVGTACCSPHACVGFLQVLQVPLTLQKQEQ